MVNRDNEGTDAIASKNNRDETTEKATTSHDDAVETNAGTSSYAKTVEEKKDTSEKIEQDKVEQEKEVALKDEVGQEVEHLNEASEKPNENSESPDSQSADMWPFLVTPCDSPSPSDVTHGILDATFSSQAYPGALQSEEPSLRKSVDATHAQSRDEAAEVDMEVGEVEGNEAEAEEVERRSQRTAG